MSRRIIKWIVGAAVVAALCYAFPLFRVRTLQQRTVQASAEPTPSTLSVADHAGRFFSTLLPKATDQATPVETLLTEAASDPGATRERFGRQVGLGGTIYFFVRGSGRVEEIADRRVRLQIDGRPEAVLLQTGLIVGNAARDATGLIDVSQFASSRDYNNLAEELNRKIETDVIQPVRDALQVGATVRFVGCVELREDVPFDPLHVTPILLEVEPSGSSL